MDSNVVGRAVLLTILEISTWTIILTIIKLHFVNNIPILTMLNILIISCLLSPSLLHGELLTVLIRSHVWIVQRCCPIRWEDSFIQLNLLILGMRVYNTILYIIMQVPFWINFLLLNVLLSNRHCVQGLAVDASNEAISGLVTLNGHVSSTLVGLHEVVVHLLEVLFVFLALVDDLAVWS